MANVGLVVADPGSLSAGDSTLQSLLAGAGHSVTLLDDSTAGAPAGYDLFVISESGSPNLAPDAFNGSSTPVVSLETAGWDNLRAAQGNATNHGSGATWTLAAHAITAGLPTGTPVAMRSGSAGRWGVTDAELGLGAEVFARHPDTGGVLGFCYDAGSGLYTGSAAAARIVCLSMIDNWPPSLTTDGQTIFLQSVAWALDALGEEHEGAAGLSGSGSLDLTASTGLAGALSLAASGTLTGSGAPAQAAGLDFSGTGGLTLDGTPAPANNLTLSGAGSLALKGRPRRDFSAKLSPPEFAWTAALDRPVWDSQVPGFAWAASAERFVWDAAADAFLWEAVAEGFAWSVPTPDFSWAAGPPDFD